jgi:hypothetical protein
MTDNNLLQIKEEIMSTLQTNGESANILERKALYKIIEILFKQNNLILPNHFDSFSDLHSIFEPDIDKYYSERIKKINLNRIFLPEVFCEYFNATERKKSHGEVFTPKSIIELMICRAKEYITEENIDICDYASGNGAILYSISQIGKSVNSINAVDIQDFSCLLTYVNTVLSSDLAPENIDVQCFDTIVERHKFLKKFDLIISNPPYMGQKNNQKLFEPLKTHNFWSIFYESKSDYQYFFIIQAIDLLKENGIACLITTQYWLTATKGNKLRKYINQNADIIEIHDFGTMKLFPNASGQENIIVILRKRELKKQVKQTFDYVCYNKKWIENNQQYWMDKQKVCSEISTSLRKLKDTEIISNIASYNKISLSKDEISGSPWYLEKSHGDIEVKRNSSTLGNYFTVQPGIQTGADKVSNKNVYVKDNIHNLSELPFQLGDGIYVLSDKELIKLNPNKKEKSVIKPFLKVGQLSLNGVKTNVNQHLIHGELIDQIDEYPNIKKHLIKFKEILNVRFKTYSLINNEKIGKWWKFVGARPSIPYTGEKIISPSRVKEPFFLYSNSEFYSSMDIFFTYSNEKDNPITLKFVNAYLNSEFVSSYLKRNCKKKGIKYELYKEPISNIPLLDNLDSTALSIINFIGGEYSTTEKIGYQYCDTSNTWIKKMGLFDYLLELQAKINNMQVKYNTDLSKTEYKEVLNQIKDKSEIQLLTHTYRTLSNDDIMNLKRSCDKLCIPDNSYLDSFNAINYMIDYLISGLIQTQLTE